MSVENLKKIDSNSHAVGIADAQPFDFEFHFARNSFSGSAPWFFVMSVENFKKIDFNSHTVGIADAQPFDFEIDFARNSFSGSAAWFFVIIVKFIYCNKMLK